MRVEQIEITVWQAMSLLGMARDGTPMSEERSRRVLREIGMKECEMNDLYPAESMDELFYLLDHPDELDKSAEEASEWMINRN